MTEKLPTRFTLPEREKVVEKAIDLIKEPETWVAGKWKCDLVLTGKDGKPILDENGYEQPARDLYNRPLSQYCIEGAIHQAMHEVLGPTRAEKLGANFEEGGIYDEETDTSIWPTDILGIDDLAREQYSEIVSDEPHAAMILNDHHSRKGLSQLGHQRILGLLKDSLAQIKTARKK